VSALLSVVIGTVHVKTLLKHSETISCGQSSQIGIVLLQQTIISMTLSGLQSSQPVSLLSLCFANPTADYQISISNISKTVQD